MNDERIEYSGMSLDDRQVVQLDDLTLGTERVLDEWRKRVRAIDLEKFECLIALTLIDDGEAYALDNPVQIGKPAAWLIALSMLLSATIRETLKPSKTREQLLILLEGLAASQSDYLDGVKHGATA